MGFGERLPVFHVASSFFRPRPHGVTSLSSFPAVLAGAPWQSLRYNTGASMWPSHRRPGESLSIRCPSSEVRWLWIVRMACVNVCVSSCVCLCVTHRQLLFSCGWTHRLLINFRSYSLASRRTQKFRLVEHIPVLFPVRLARFLLIARSNQDGHGLPASWTLDNDFIHWCKLYFFLLNRTIYQVDVTGLGHF